MFLKLNQRGFLSLYFRLLQNCYARQRLRFIPFPDLYNIEKCSQNVISGLSIILMLKFNIVHVIATVIFFNSKRYQIILNIKFKLSTEFQIKNISVS